MKILGIETSCDETACAVVENGRKILANTVASQIDLHAKTGGVVPEVAAREHVLKMMPVLDECLEECGCSWDEINAVAVTKGPGLVSSLIIGTETANVISYVKDKPMIPVQHITGHIYANWLERDEEPAFPIVILTVSGGHNEIILMRDHFDFEVLGETRDDAAGEAFDKVARILGLGYPGGPAISKIAESANGKAFDLPRSYLEKGSLDFSFSGLKTAVMNVARDLDENSKADLAASFQEAVCDVLSDKLIMAAEKMGVKEVHLAGGVSANLRLREMIKEKLPEDIEFRYPKEIHYCTDNAAMIAAAGYFHYQKSPEKFTSKTNIVPTTSFEV
jgi:tRNA N6-adenosine threonylcarbamoyltransferase